MDADAMDMALVELRTYRDTSVVAAEAHSLNEHVNMETARCNSSLDEC